MPTLAALLDLALPDAPWHGHRDRLAEVASAFAILTGTCGKIARDVSLLMQTEVAEAFEPAAPGRGGSSSSMPHKRDPVSTAAALAAATIAPNLAATILAAQVQEHERGLGGWQAEWLTFPALALVTSGALDAIVEIAEGLEVDSERMRANLEASHGLIMGEAVSFALAAKIGKPNADRIVEEASRKAASANRDLEDVLAEDDQVKTEPEPWRPCQAVRADGLPGSHRRVTACTPRQTVTAKQVVLQGSPVAESNSAGCDPWSKLVPRFRSSPALAALLMRTSEIKRGTSNFMILLRFLNLKFLHELAAQMIGTSNSPH